MSSIEEILNAEDSDDEGGGIHDSMDLEHLLHSKDDQDEDIGELFRIDHQYLLDEQEVQLPASSHSAITGSDITGAVGEQDIPRSTSNDSDVANRIKLNSLDMEGAHPIVSASAGISHEVELGALAKAESREREFLLAGKRDAISALQAKRNSAAVSNYSSAKCEDFEKITDQLRRNSTYKQHGPGSATAMAACERFTAVGTSKGLIILFDHSEEIQQVLGSNLPVGARPAVPVTALDAPRRLLSGPQSSAQGPLLAGYASGEVALWDASSGALLKVVNDLHLCGVVAVCAVEVVSEGLSTHSAADPEVFALPAQRRPEERSASVSKGLDLSGFITSTGATAQLSGMSLVLVSADQEGVMYRTTFAKTLWSSAYTAESDCLLDSSTGRVTSVAALQPVLRAVDAACSGIGSGSRLQEICCRYLATHRSTRMLALNLLNSAQTWVVQTHPKIKIVYKWESPTPPNMPATDGGDGQGNMAVTSCLDWAWVPESRISPDASSADAADDWVPVLARSWGDVLQTLVLRTTVSATSADAAQGRSSARANTAAAAAQVSSFGAALTSFMSGSTSSATTRPAAMRADVEPQQRTYQSRLCEGSRIALSGQKVVALRWASPRELVVLTVSDVIILSPNLHIVEQLYVAPSLSVDLGLIYSKAREEVHASGEGIVSDVVDKKMLFLVHERLVSIQTQSVFEQAEKLVAKAQWLEALALVVNVLRKAPSSVQCDTLADADRFIIRYAELAVKQHSAAAGAVTGKDALNAAAQARSHIHLVAGVCIEFCVSCGRLEVLFGSVYHVFRVAQHQHLFLEALEPFILSREIPSMPPGVIAEFCQSALRSHRLPAIERCVVYFEVPNLDVNFLTRFLFENRMYSGFLYVFANGLNDFAGAFQVVFSFMLQPVESGWQLQNSPTRDCVPELAQIGYKLMLFLSYTFEGRVFPRGDVSSSGLDSVQIEALLDVVTSPRLLPVPAMFAHQSEASLASSSSAPDAHPYLRALGSVDNTALCSVLRKGVRHLLELGDSADAQAGSALHIKVGAVLERLWQHCCSTAGASPSNIFYDMYLADVAACKCRLSPAFLCEMVEQRPASSRVSHHVMEATFAAIAEQQTRAGALSQCAGFREVLRAHNFWIASLAAAKSVSSSEKEELLKEQRFESALQHYLNAPETEHTGQVFAYIDLAFTVVGTVFPLSNRQPLEDSLCRDVLAILLELAQSNLSRAQVLVRDHFSGRVVEVLDHCGRDPKLRYRLVDALLFQPDQLLSARVALLTSSFTPEALQVYLADLAIYEPARVLEFLRTFEPHYSVDDCLQVCRQKGLSEAVSFLMERSGQALDALVMLLKDFSNRLKQVRRDVDAQLRSELAAQAAAAKANVRISAQDAERYVVTTILSRQDGDRAKTAMRLPGYQSLKGLIECVADLCARNAEGDGAGMWLMAFDHLLMERLAVRSGTVSSSGEVIVVIIGLMLQALLGHMSAASAQVTPQEVIRRVTAQGNAAGIRLGEFKGMMLSMLAANAQELALHECLVRIVRADLGMLHRQKVARLRRYSCKSDAQGAGAVGGMVGENGVSASLPVPLDERGPHRTQPLVARSYMQFFSEAAMTPADSSAAVFLLGTGVPALPAGTGPAREGRRPGSLDRVAMYQAHK